MISIITPTYNTKQEYLNTFLESLSKQSVQDFELVLINDGGSPVKIPEGYKFSIKYIDNPSNNGPGFCRQMGIEQASYNYVTFCDSDDYFYDNDVIEKYIAIINNNHPEIIIPKIISTIKLEEQDENFVFLHGLCIQRDFLKKYNIVFPNSYFGEDRIFLHVCRSYQPYRIICDTIAIQHVPRPDSLFDFSGHDASACIYDLFLQLVLIYVFSLNPDYYYLQQQDACTTLLSNCMFIQQQNRCPDEIYYVIKQYESYIYSCLWRYLPSDIKATVNDCRVSNKEIEELHISLLNNVNILTDLFPNKTFLDPTLRTLIDQAYSLWQNRNFEKTHEDDRPVFTIVCPTYNNSKEELLDFFSSINKQSALHLIKLLLIDDCSTLGILTDEFIDNNLNVPWEIIRLPFNRGVGHARKVGFDATDTTFFMIMDADDELGSEYIVEEYYTYLNLHPEYAGAYGVEYNSIAQDFCHDLGMHGLCGRTKAIKPYVNFRSFHYGEDISFLVECKMQGLNFTFIPTIAYVRKASHLTGDINGDIAYFLSLNELYNEISIYVNIQNKTNNLSQQEFDRAKTSLFLNTFMRYAFYLYKKENSDSWQQGLYIPMPDFITGIDRATLYLYYTIAICKTIPKETLYQLYTYTIHEGNHYGTLPEPFYYVIGNILLNNDNWSTDYDWEPISFKELTDRAKAAINRVYEYAKESHQGRIPSQTQRNFPWCYDTYIYH